MSSPYAECVISLTTKHKKAEAIAPIFKEILGAHVFESCQDTDLLGTFSGEIERNKTPKECAKEKCLWGFSDPSFLYSLASEGSFGPHPFLPFTSCGEEILYFIDKKREFHLVVSEISTSTNYLTKEIDSLDTLFEYAKKAQFPSHALILGHLKQKQNGFLVKGITCFEVLEKAFYDAKKISANEPLWLQTDMRAHLNPTRMKSIQELARTLALRLKTPCPSCSTPGWGKKKIERGLLCRVCHNETDRIKAEIFGCQVCSYQEKVYYPSGIHYSEPDTCSFCNP